MSYVVLQSCKVLSVTLPETKGRGREGLFFKGRKVIIPLTFSLMTRKKLCFQQCDLEGHLGVSILSTYFKRSILALMAEK